MNVYFDISYEAMPNHPSNKKDLYMIKNILANILWLGAAMKYDKADILSSKNV